MFEAYKRVRSRKNSVLIKNADFDKKFRFEIKIQRTLTKKFDLKF